jgi:hypothetical protein
VANTDLSSTKEYQSGTSTTAGSASEAEPRPAEMLVEAEKYGVAKPRKVVVRAKVIND